MKQERVASGTPDLTGASGHRNALIRGRRELGCRQPRAVPASNVSEGAADIDPDRHVVNADVGPRDHARPDGRSWPGAGSADRKCVVIRIDPTPNPNAVKFSVGKPVGGPATFVAGQPTDNPMASSILELEGVTSIFMTADFVTISKGPEADWGAIVPGAQAILEEHYG